MTTLHEYYKRVDGLTDSVIEQMTNELFNQAEAWKAMLTKVMLCKHFELARDAIHKLAQASDNIGYQDILGELEQWACKLPRLSDKPIQPKLL